MQSLKRTGTTCCKSSHAKLPTILLVLLASLLGSPFNLWAIPPIQHFYPSADFPNHADYIAFLERFPTYAESEWHSGYQGDSRLGYFSNGVHDHNQMRVLANFIFVYGLLAAETGGNRAAPQISRETLLNRVRAALRYFTATHVTGGIVCTDGEKWGAQPHQWLSPWVISKAVAGARMIWDELTQEETDAIRRVVVHEADFQLGNRVFSREYEDTQAELNALNAEVLAWATSLYPNHPNAERWLSKAQELFMNTFSVEADSNDTTVVDGKPVNEWVNTTNAHPDFTLEGHGAYQFDYIAVPLHSLAWAYYAFVSNGQPVPQTLFHHLTDVWDTLKRTHLYSGRFAYFQGKDWGRHVYGPYFIIPALVMLENELGDSDARLIEQLRFRALAWEQQQNSGGSIFGARFANQRQGWPLIYETDSYANMGLAYLLHQFSPSIGAENVYTFQKKLEGSFHSEYCQYLYTRTENLFVSFSWQHLSGHYPMALFVPGDDNMVEWARGNFIGNVFIKDTDTPPLLLHHNERFIQGGFVATGQLREGRRGNTDGLDHYISFTAMPEDGTALMMEYLVARETIAVSAQAGLTYHLPNGIFNDNQRQIYSAGDAVILSAGSSPGEDITIDSAWINIDDKLGIINVRNDGAFRIRPGRRNIWNGQITERIDYVPTSQPHFGAGEYEQGDIVREGGYLLISGDRDATRSMVSKLQWLATSESLVKAVKLVTEESDRLIVANFNNGPVNAEIPFYSGTGASMHLPALDTVIHDGPLTEIAHEMDDSTMVLVPEGEFIMGTSDSQLDEITRRNPALRELFKHEQPQHTVYLDAFYIDKYEVTNAQFEKFVNATGYITDAERENWGFVWEGGNVWPQIQGANWRAPLGHGSTIKDKMNHPVVQVSYNDAVAYTKWAGKRLPTEAEWEKASRGTDARIFPWGNEWDPTRLNSLELGPRTTTPVGSFPEGASPYGALDMVGNVWESVSDWYNHAYYSSLTEWNNPQGPAFGIHRAFRGACWMNKRHVTRCAHRDNHVSTPDFRIHLGGFRCAMSYADFIERTQTVPQDSVNPEDVNLDGVIDVADLVIAGMQFGQTPPKNPAADVNRDGTVDVDDLIQISERLGVNLAAPSAPSNVRGILSSLPQIPHPEPLPADGIAAIQGALAELEALTNPSSAAITARNLLRAWLTQRQSAAKETKLLPNYPNPFNPETWIPYQLASDASVEISIYDSDGAIVRQLKLGHQRAGYYIDRERAAFWDGRSQTGERVASGLYFYQLRAGDYVSVKRMVIVK